MSKIHIDKRELSILTGTVGENQKKTRSLYAFWLSAWKKQGIGLPKKRAVLTRLHRLH